MIPHNQHVLMYLCKIIIIMFSRTNKHIDLKHIEEPSRGTLKTHAAFKVPFFPKPYTQRGIAADLLYMSRLTRLKHARIWLLEDDLECFCAWRHIIWTEYSKNFRERQALKRLIYWFFA